MSVDEQTQIFLRDLRLQRLRLLEQDLSSIKASFPGICDDAEKFVGSTHLLPWEIVAMYQEGELGDIQEKYGVTGMRHRPASRAITPETDIFCEACELLYVKWALGVNADNILGYNVSS